MWQLVWAPFVNSVTPAPHLGTEKHEWKRTDGCIIFFVGIVISPLRCTQQLPYQDSCCRTIIVYVFTKPGEMLRKKERSVGTSGTCMCLITANILMALLDVSTGKAFQFLKS